MLTIHLLRVLHILGASFWFGAAVLNTGFIAPTVRAIGPAGGQFMGHIMGVRKLPIYMNVASLTTVLSGLALYGWRSGGFRSDWMHTPSGMVFGLGGLAALLALVIGYFFVGRSAMRLRDLMAAAQAPGGNPPSPEAAEELRRLQLRMGNGAAIVTVLIAVATIAMALGRYA